MAVGRGFVFPDFLAAGEIEPVDAAVDGAYEYAAAGALRFRDLRALCARPTLAVVAANDLFFETERRGTESKDEELESRPPR